MSSISSVPSRPAALRYTVAVLAVAIGAAGRLTVLEWLGDQTAPFITFFPAVMGAALFGGVGPGILAVLLSTVVALLLWTPLDQFGGLTAPAAVVLFAIVSGVIVWLADRAREARMRAERAENGMDAVLSSITDGFTALDVNWRYVYVNDAAQQHLGHARADLIGRVLWEVFPDTEDSPVGDVYRRAMQERQPVVADVPSVVQPGRWVHLRCYPTTDGVSAFFRDITDERAAQEAHLRNEVRLRDALRAARMAAWDLTAAEGRIAYSDAALETLGIATVDLPVTPEGAIAFVHPSDRDAHLARVAAAAAAPDHSYVSTFRVNPEIQQDATAEIWLEDRGRLMMDVSGAALGARGVLQDVSASRKVEAHVSQLNAQLQQRIEELQTILDVAPVGIAFAEDPSCQRMIASAGFSRMLQIAPGENVSVSRPDAETLPYRVLRDGREVAPETMPMQVAARTGEAVWDYECDLALEDGTVKHLLISAAPLFDETGQVRGAIGIHVDISARVTADLERRRLLQAAESARADAERSNRAKDDFLAVLSHELRSPLQSVLGWVQVLRTASVRSDEFQRALATIERNVRQQSQLVNDMLDVSRIVTGKLTFHMHPVRVREMVEETLDELQPQASGRSLTVAVDLDDTAVVVADRGRLQQVVANLFTNAVKFTPPGGRISLSSRVDDEQVVIEVRDTGDGIDPALLEDVFDRFRQADASSTRQHEGLGLGLAIARHIVEQHEGTIAAHSEGPGTGSRFVVRLPRAAPAAAEPSVPTAQPATRQPLAGVRVLVVDDHRDTLDLLQYVLSLAGAAVFTAESVDVAIAAMARQRPDVLVTDLSMPGADGYALLTMVRRDFGPGLPAIALSGFARAEDRRRALAAGFDVHMSKPVDPSSLVRVLVDTVAPRV